MDPWSQALFRLGDGFLRMLGGAPTEAERELQEALHAFRYLGECWGTTQAPDWLAVLADRRGDQGRSLALTDEALQLLA